MTGLCGGACAGDCGGACSCGCRGCRPSLPGSNRPGLSEVRYGRTQYGAVFDRMRGRLSSDDLPGVAPLTARSTEDTLDPALAVLDAWACLSEVLGFYTERAVDEGYLRTCTERFSAVALAALVGFEPRPGVAADAWLAFLLEDLDREAALDVPTGTRAYSVPAPGETMQPFETVERLGGRPRWSRMHPRATAPQWLVPASPNSGRPPGLGPQDVTAGGEPVWFSGTATGLQPGQPLLFDFRGRGKAGRVIRSVEQFPSTAGTGAEPVSAARTRVALRSGAPAASSGGEAVVSGDVVRGLLSPAARHTARGDSLSLDPEAVFAGRSYAPMAALGAVFPQLKGTLADAVAGAPPTGATGTVTAYAMRITAPIHGHNAARMPTEVVRGIVQAYAEWPLSGELPKNQHAVAWNEIALDSVYAAIAPGSQVAVIVPGPEDARRDRGGEDGFDGTRVFVVDAVRSESRTAFNVPSRVTVLTLDRNWFEPTEADDFGSIRSTIVHAHSDRLDLAERPLELDVGGPEIVLDGHYPGIEPGRRLIVSGERADLNGVDGVEASELVMVSGVSHRSLPDDEWSTHDRVHTYLELTAGGLRYEYRRSSVTIYGNVAHATHGESRAEVLGSGDAAQDLQIFDLKQPPLTYVSAPTPSGVASTLDVRVNGLRWHPAPNAAAVRPDTHTYRLTNTADDRTAVVVGLGAHLPTGRDNVRATYRSGLGRMGNVRAGQISVLGSQPAGVMGVTNPIATTGGADGDDLAQVRGLAPIGLSSLDRIVSAADIEDFARNFAGVGKARVWQREAQKLVLSVAGEDDVPLTADSVLVRNLAAAVAVAGDFEMSAEGVLVTRNRPALELSVEIRTARLIALRARVCVHPDHLWADVFPRVREALLGRLGFAARQLGEALDPSAVMAAAHKVRGVVAVDLQGIGTIDVAAAAETGDPMADIAAQALAAVTQPVNGRIPPVSPVPDGAIAYLAPESSGTLLLSAWETE